MSQASISSGTPAKDLQVLNTGSIEFHKFLSAVRARFDEIIAKNGTQLYTTDTNINTLWSAYLSGFETEQWRQHHNCNCCRQFIQRYGSLVSIDKNGAAVSPLWGTVAQIPELYKKSVSAMRTLVSRSSVEGVFASELKILGTPQTRDFQNPNGFWRHFNVTNPSVHTDRVKTAYQYSAAKREDHITVINATVEFSRNTLDEAVKLLSSDKLYRSDKVLPGAKWLQSFMEMRNRYTGKTRNSLSWKMIAEAPAGFCHPRSGMLGTLIEDMEEGKHIEEVKANFRAKMDGLSYQRPQAAPAAGNIKRAEELVAKLGIEPSLRRRYATITDLQLLWIPSRPTPVEAQRSTGVFASVKPKQAQARAEPQRTSGVENITWSRFYDKVLNTADSIEVYTGLSRTVFRGFVTAAVEGSPPILQWDLENARNPVSWYVYNGGSLPLEFGLQTSTWVECEGVADLPSNWNPNIQGRHGSAVTFIMKGAHDTRQSGSALFPEILKGELHEVRATIEAYSRANNLEGLKRSQAAGISISNDSRGTTVRVRVTSGNVISEYLIDRWN